MNQQSVARRRVPIRIWRVECSRASMQILDLVSLGPSGSSSITATVPSLTPWRPERVFLPGLYIDWYEDLLRVEVVQDEDSIGIVGRNLIPIPADTLFFLHGEFTLDLDGNVSACRYRANPANQYLTPVSRHQKEEFARFTNGF